MSNLSPASTDTSPTRRQCRPHALSSSVPSRSSQRVRPCVCRSHFAARPMPLSARADWIALAIARLPWIALQTQLPAGTAAVLSSAQPQRLVPRLQPLLHLRSLGEFERPPGERSRDGMGRDRSHRADRHRASYSSTRTQLPLDAVHLASGGTQHPQCAADAPAVEPALYHLRAAAQLALIHCQPSDGQRPLHRCARAFC